MVPLVYIYNIFIDGFHNIVPLRCSWHHRTFGRSARGLSGVSGQVHPVSPPPPPVLQGNKVPSTHWKDLVRLQGDHWQGNAISRQDDIHVSSGTVSRHVAWDNIQRVASQGRDLRVRDVCHHSPIEILSNVCDRTGFISFRRLQVLVDPALHVIVVNSPPAFGDGLSTFFDHDSQGCSRSGNHFLPHIGIYSKPCAARSAGSCTSMMITGSLMPSSNMVLQSV